MIPPDFRAEYGIFFINDSLVVGTSSAEYESYLWKEKGPFTKMQHFFRYNPKSKGIAWRKPFPLLEFSNKLECGFIYQDWPILKPDGTRIACSFTYFDQIIIYNIEGQDLIRIISPIKPPRLVLPDQSEWSKMNRYYYIHGYATNNYIYTVYRNDTYENLVNEENKAEIHVFDWEGNGVCKYKTKFPLNNITVDEHQGIIYAGQESVSGDAVIFKIGPELKFKSK
jgi:hypothetical protein